MKNSRWFALLALTFFLCMVPRQGRADEYDDSQSNPLRVVAYVTHPVGVAIEWLAAMPFHFLVSATPAQEYIFGHQPHPPIFPESSGGYDFGVSKAAPMYTTEAPKKAAAQEPVAEKVTVKEVAVEKQVIKEVPKIVEVESVVFPEVAFRFDSAQLTDLGKGEIYLVAQKLKEKSEVVVAIEGHADYVGGEKYNQQLGLRRAEMVQKELAQLGIEPARMTVASFGKSKPAIDQKTDWARAVNRRVEFRIAAP